MTHTLFIFFRDFRIHDNTGLIHAMKTYKNIIPCFIFVNEQINPRMNKYFSHNCVQFLCESLKDLNDHLVKKGRELYVFKSPNIGAALLSIKQTYDIDTIVYNIDYSPYAKKRDKVIEKWCKTHGVGMDRTEDYLLAPIGEYLKPDNSVYSVYTPFRNNVMKNLTKINKPANSNTRNIAQCDELKHSPYFLSIDDLQRLYIRNPLKLVTGGRQRGLSLLLQTKKMDYDRNRDQLIFETSRLSAYIKFGNISIREVFWKFYNDNQEGLVNQLIWREFYFYIAFYHPKVLDQEKGRSKNYNEKYNSIKWVNKKSWFDAWKSGNTGYPIVDACMKELNTTGYMHNRGRLISANFLNRILGHDWRKGEHYFATKLTDYDPCVNNGNWQWIASTGTDTKPYFQRLFNPWLQSEKADKQAKYIKKWLPQLKNIPAKELHQWDQHCEKYNMQELGYIFPIVEYSEARERSIKQYRGEY